jgi:hypothetical protein
MSLVFDLMYPPMKPDSKYLTGFGISTVSGAKCFLEPVNESGKAAGRLKLKGLDFAAFPSEHFELVGSLTL